MNNMYFMVETGLRDEDGNWLTKRKLFDPGTTLDQVYGWIKSCGSNDDRSFNIVVVEN